LGIRPDLREVEFGRWTEHGPFRFKLVPVSHSVPDAGAVAFDTPEGVILHSGDFKLDPTPIDDRPTDLPAFAALAAEGVRLLLCDSTNAESARLRALGAVAGRAHRRHRARCPRPGDRRLLLLPHPPGPADRRGGDRRRAQDRLLREVDAAQRGRRPGVGGARGLGRARGRHQGSRRAPAHRQLLLTTGSQGEPFAALSLIAHGRHRFVTIEPEDTILISATPIPGNETAVSKVISGLLRRGARVYHGRNARVHVSGHAAQDELLTYLNVVRPRAFVPVHGEYRHLHANAALARRMQVPWVEVLEDGDAVVVDGDETRVERDSVDAGYVYLDGSSFGDVKRAVLRDRSRLADEGVVVVTVGVDHRTGALVYGPDLDSHGVMDSPYPVLEKAADAVRAAVEAAAGDRAFDLSAVQQTVRQATAKVFRAETSRKPVILPVVLEL
jgi:ribonuclease J